MAHEDDLPAPEKQPSRRRWRAALMGILFLLAVAIAFGWVSRKTIADDFIASQMEGLGLPSAYEVAEIGPSEQVIRNLVIGDPARPDLTIEEVRVKTKLWFGLPGIGQITIVRPKLSGQIVDGKPTFGALDSILFTDSKEPFRLPDFDLAIEEGVARIQTDFGPVALALSGAGELRDGFNGRLAAIAPRIEAEDCVVEGAKLSAEIAVASGKPRLKGPLRIKSVNCEAADLNVRGAKLLTDIAFGEQLDAAEGKAELLTGTIKAAKVSAKQLNAKTRFTFRKSVLAVHYDVAGGGIAAPHFRAGDLKATGWVRTAHDGTNLQVDGDVSGQNIAGGPDLDALLADVQKSSAQTLASPLIRKIRDGLAQETQSSSLNGSFFVRRNANGLSFVIPRASLRGRSGQSIIAVSRVQALTGVKGLTHVSGNFATGGVGLPRITGRMEQIGAGQLSLNLSMQAYQADTASLSVPDLVVTQSRSGALGFTGTVLASGALPGGQAQNVLLPVDGTWADGRLSMWQTCTQVRFDSLTLTSLTLDRRELALCPARGRPLLLLADGEVDVAGGVSALDVTGRLGSTPVKIASGPVGFAYPGIITAREVDVKLGPADSASHFRIANLHARTGQDIAGTFDGSDVALFAVPLDLKDVRGNWRYADGTLVLSEGSFRLEDREQVDRFRPVISRDASLTLRNNVIHADALMREPISDRGVVDAKIQHNLLNVQGRTDLTVQGITFDNKLQPETLTALALGIVANTQGSVRGSGEITWDEVGVKSTGEFTTDNLDFAAAFGPVKGVTGTIRFTDLLGLVTEPDQQLKIASINPGIEVNEGVITYALQPDFVIAVKGGVWPFVGGVLQLMPTQMAVGTDAAQTYTLVVTGADAALFVQRLEISNLNATGTFDGTLPLIFDQNGGRIEGGQLQSRPPGGNVSYVGELTYKDLSPMANFAFSTLRSLDYQNMTIGMNGALEGEIVTRISFSGVKQGEGTSQNFLTRKIASLPIRFNVNLRAPFFQLVSSFKSLYDPALVRDPRSIGLLDGEGVPRPDLVAPTPLPLKQPIQPDASEIRP